MRVVAIEALTEGGMCAERYETTKNRAIRR